ncbi:hypothetical protein G6F63_015887 [Rhizopus arrhizus]|nr:hypothetical protein G6F63_015887 [Rhizopus arrhizus]
MTFDDVSLALTVGDSEAGTLQARPGISIGGTSADVINVDLVPSSAARLIVADALAGVYKKLVIRGDKLVGACLYGDTADGAWYMRLIRDGQDVGGLRDQLMAGESAAGG